MEVALTFGSLGDIIELVQLAIKLGRAIGVGGAAVTGTSAKEYQELRHDLDILVSVLMQVVATYQQHELNTPLQVLDNVTKLVVGELATLIQDALNHLQSRYGSSLTKEGSGKKAKDIYRRVEWCMREKDRLRMLQEKLQKGVQRLTLLSTISARKSARVDNETLLARIDTVQRLCQDKHQQVLELLEKQKLEHIEQSEQQNDQLQAIQTKLGTTEQHSRTLLSMAADAVQGIVEIKDLLLSVSKTVINLQISATQTQCLRSLDPTKELSVTLEDSLGRQIPIPAEWLDTLEWTALEYLLVGLFRGKKGQDMVRRREYALEESASGRDLSSAMPLSQCLRRGMKINMSMIFPEDRAVAGCCPRCHTLVDALEGVNILCTVPDCGMWFRMQKMEITDTTVPEPGVAGSEFAPASQDTTVVTSIPAEPGDFLRVRLLRLSMRVSMEYLQSEAIKTDESLFVDTEIPEDTGRYFDSDDVEYDLSTTAGFRRRRRPVVYINGERVEMSNSRDRLYTDDMRAQTAADTRRERVVIVDTPPRPRTELSHSMPMTKPSRPFDLEDLPATVDARPQIYEAQGRPRYRRVVEDEDRLKRLRERVKAAHEKLLEHEETRLLIQRINRSNEEISRRPTGGPRDGFVYDIAEAERRQAHHDAFESESARDRLPQLGINPDRSFSPRPENVFEREDLRHREYVEMQAMLQRERVEMEAIEQRLRERVAPRRRTTVQPASRGTQATSNHGNYVSRGTEVDYDSAGSGYMSHATGTTRAGVAYHV